MAPSDPSSQSGAPNLSAGINITLIVMFLSFTYFRESPPDQSRNYPTLTLQPNLIDVQTRRYHVEGRAVHLDEVQEAEKVEQPHLRPKSLVESYCLPNVPCHLHCPEASGPETCDRSSMHSPPSGASLTISTPLSRSTPDIVRCNATSVRRRPISIILAVCSGEGANSIRGRNKPGERCTQRNFSQFSPEISFTFFSVGFSFWRQNKPGKWLKKGAARLIHSNRTSFLTDIVAKA